MKAVVYARVSTEDQNSDRQINELNNHAITLGYRVIENFYENISGRTKQVDRPEFSRMLKFARENEIKHIFVHELSRIGRNNRNTINIIEDLISEGICIHSKHENISTLNPDGSKNHNATLFISIFSAIAESEVETLRTRVKSGLRSSKLKGGANGAVQPYGFQSVNKLLAINPDEAQMVRIIYDKYLNGFSMHKIAQHLNDLKISTRKGKQWVDKTVNDILHNPLYKGERFHNGEKMPYNLDIIIPFQKWQAVQDLIKKKALYNHRDSKNINLLKSLVFCGNCGKPLHMHRRKDLSDNAYKCLSTKLRYAENACGLIGINIDLLNMFILTIIMMSDRFDWNKIKSKTEKHNQQLNTKITNVEAHVEELTKELSKLTRSFMKGHVNERIFLEISEDHEANIKKDRNRIEKFKQQLKVVPEQTKEFKFDMAGENFIGEFQKVISRIDISNVPLEVTPFNQRKDNVVYKIDITMSYPNEVLTNYISSRDKRVFTLVGADDGVISTDDGFQLKNYREVWNYSGFSLDNSKKIVI